jgi:Mrp family chromosome partitioning ATPase
MSQNFEVLLRAEREAELFQPAAVAEETPQVRRPHVHIDPIVRDAETKLAQRVFLLSGSKPPQVVVFCGVEDGGGASGICARVGQILAAQTCSPVCLVDANARNPSLSHYFGVDEPAGLTNAVLESGSIHSFVHRLPESNLFLLPAGSYRAEAQGLWTPERLRSRVAELRREFSFVLIYAPPASLHVDAMLFGQVADGVILVVESNSTRRDTARKAKDNLTATNVKLLGAVVNNRTFPIPESLYRKL